jgi:hypothetical protein
MIANLVSPLKSSIFRELHLGPFGRLHGIGKLIDLDKIKCDPFAYGTLSSLRAVPEQPQETWHTCLSDKQTVLEGQGWQQLSGTPQTKGNCAPKECITTHDHCQ